MATVQNLALSSQHLPPHIYKGQTYGNAYHADFLDSLRFFWPQVLGQMQPLTAAADGQARRFRLR